MKYGLAAIFAVGLLAASAGVAHAQRLPPLPPPPVSLEVPHPIPPVSPSPQRPRDLYQQLTPPPTFPPTVIVNPGFVYGPFGYLASPYMPSPYMPTMLPGYAQVMPRPAAHGWLRFESVPGAAQVFIDGYYAGLVEDFGVSGRALDLEVGPHHVELRAPGYASLSFEIRIEANQILRYRGDLQRLTLPPAAAPPAASLSSTPKLTYVIPNCYAGDRPPTRALPQGCSVAQMRVDK